MRELNIEPIRAVERAIQILNCFSFEKPVLSIDEIMTKTKLAKATIYRLLWTLERNDLIQYDQSLNKYRLGNKPLEYGGIVLANLDIRREAEPYMQDLHEQTGHSIILAKQQDDSIQYLVRYDSDEGLLPTNFVGRRRTLHNGALGIVLLSYMDKDFVHDLLKRYPLEQHTPKTVVDESRFLERLNEIRDVGYYVDEDETFMGYTAIATPIFNEKNEAIAALAISGASFKMEGTRRKELTNLVKDVALKISKQMGLR